MIDVRLTDALHARPADLVVKLASRFASRITVRYGAKTADAKNIIAVLGLGAPKGEVVQLEAEGTDARDALEAVRLLVARGFDRDLVPELGAAAVEGIAIGRVVNFATDDAPAAPTTDAAAPPALDAALARVTSDLEALVASLPAAEATLFAPEIAIVRDLGPVLAARVAKGENAEDAVRAATAAGVTDLVLDARVRILDALRGDVGALDARLAGVTGDIIVATEELTPSLVARLPRRVVGIVAAEPDRSEAKGETSPDDSVPEFAAAADASARPAFFTSHAALLARGRGVPLCMVPSHVVYALESGERAIVDTTTTPSRVFAAPSDAMVADATARRDALVRAREESADRAAQKNERIAVRVNIGAADEEVPRGAEGIGLVRTELVFAVDAHAPSVTRQTEVLARIAARAPGAPVVVRLFDAGGDKPLSWLAAPASAPDARGVELLLAHDALLRAQLEATGLVRGQGHAGVRVLVPLVRDARDMHAVRAAAPAGLPVGAMIETREAVTRIDDIAAASDFLSIGTNDLTASVLGASREHGRLAVNDEVLACIRTVVERGHAAGKQVTVCGEYAASEAGARTLLAMGVDALSVPPPRFAAVKLSLA